MADRFELWVLEPRAHPDDPIWQDRKIWRKVVVAARNPAFARLVAEYWALGDGVAGPGNESPSPIAGFRDEKLYMVRNLRPDENEAPDGGFVVMAELLRS